MHKESELCHQLVSLAETEHSGSLQSQYVTKLGVTAL